MGYQRFERYDNQLTISTSAYAAGDVVGGLLTFTLDAVTTSTGNVWINDVIVVDDDNKKAAFTLYLFDNLPTTIADQAAYAPTIADMKKWVGKIVIAVGDYESIGAGAWAKATPSEGAITMQAFKGNKVYAYLVATATPTYTAATDLYLRLGVSTQEMG